MNNLKPLAEKYFNKKLIANNDETKVVAKPTISGKKLNELNLLKEEINSTIAAREIAGMPKKKRKFDSINSFPT